ncbi:C39 family peptidase [Bacillus sp. BRMEA1]|uniref:C39 family peptidase n=1 Tax=Neobacillus endophyticus TaxID=2738405 RepID=UPI001566FF32|nr:C39 family peptidase [Neobacillus endophyticus]NRD78029.1 C39 family peptidase [Neobacillus endophyticus]
MILFVLLISIVGGETIFADKFNASKPAANSFSTLKPRVSALQVKEPILPESKLLDVPLINQMDPPMLYNGCEVTSLAMILNYSGIKVTKNELASHIRTVPLTYDNGQKGNPNEGFVGDMINGPGYAVYNGPVFELAKKYAGNRAVNLTGSPLTDLLKKVSQGKAVWVITTVDFAPVSEFEAWDTPQGNIQISFNEHSVVITGYDAHSIYINDPYGDKNEKLDRGNFEKAWNQMGRQAIVINN